MMPASSQSHDERTMAERRKKKDILLSRAVGGRVLLYNGVSKDFMSYLWEDHGEGEAAQHREALHYLPQNFQCQVAH